MEEKRKRLIKLYGEWKIAIRIEISIFCLTHIDTNDEKRSHPEEDPEENAFKNREQKK
jgi:hypothetical protein